MAGQGVSASKLNPSEKRAMESNPAVVLGSVMYEVNGRFQVGGETVFFGPVAVGGTGSSAMLTGIVLPTYRGTVPEMISAVHLANGAAYRVDTKIFSDPIDRGGKDVAILKINSGTHVTARMIGSVDSSRDRPGRRFEASVDGPVMAGARTVIPRGATARVLFVNTSQAGHIEERNSVTLDLVGLTIGGKNYSARSSWFEKQGASRGKPSAEVIGGAAAAGAGAGTVAQFMSNAEPVTIQSETRIEFTLRTPVTLTP
jgi:hypothetical protein